MISFHSLYVISKQNYLHSIHFHSFILKLPIKITQFHSILFHSFPLLKYISFHSFTFHYDHSIPFSYELPNETLEILNYIWKGLCDRELAALYFIVVLYCIATVLD